MCAVCMPTCPTYQASQDENLSPRGRISLVQAVIQNKITLSDNVISHFDSCLQCMNCQNICPSQVKYGEIINYALEQSFSHRKSKWVSISLFSNQFSSQISDLILVNKTFRKSFILVINFLINSKLLPILKRFALKFNIKSLSLLPVSYIQLPGILPKQKDSINITDNTSNTQHNIRQNSSNITIFSGCATALFDSQLLAQACHLFELLQVSIITIDSENCCGAIYKRQGNIEKLSKLKELANNNYPPNTQLVSLNSACSGYMKKTSADNDYSVDDVISVLANKFGDRLKKIKFHPFPGKVLFHQSCSMRNILKNQNDCFKLLKLIPNIKITLFPQISCCGASGNYMLSHAELSEKIVNPYIEFIIKENIHVMVSTDISCSLHIKQQLEKQNYHLEVLHPVSLLHQQLI
ncbi:MAG: (Fe-S)-binding protein [Pseudomonadota bacterium]